MQAYKDDDLVATHSGMLDELEYRKNELILGGKADRAVISNLPSPGTEVPINGLVFVVTRVNEFGKVIMMLKKP